MHVRYTKLIIIHQNLLGSHGRRFPPSLSLLCVGQQLLDKFIFLKQIIFINLWHNDVVGTGPGVLVDNLVDQQLQWTYMKNEREVLGKAQHLATK